MKTENSWEDFFDKHAPYYMQNVFTKNTEAEIKFLLEELNLPAGSSILDIGCGTGRHSVELAKHGFRMTGVDLSSGMLAEAQKAARQAGVEIDWVHSNALDYKAPEKFEAALCLCEGAMALLDPDEDPHEHDLTILNNIHKSLKPRGKFILTTLNALEKMARYLKGELNADNFNLYSMVETEKIPIETAEGVREYLTREKGYTVGELKLMLRLTGFKVGNVWGGTAGSWNRQPLSPQEIEIMVTAEKL